MMVGERCVGIGMASGWLQMIVVVGTAGPILLTIACSGTNFLAYDDDIVIFITGCDRWLSLIVIDHEWFGRYWHVNYGNW